MTRSHSQAVYGHRQCHEQLKYVVSEHSKVLGVRSVKASETWAGSPSWLGSGGRGGKAFLAGQRMKTMAGWSSEGL